MRSVEALGRPPTFGRRHSWLEPDPEAWAALAWEPGLGPDRGPVIGPSLAGTPWLRRFPEGVTVSATTSAVMRNGRHFAQFTLEHGKSAKTALRTRFLECFARVQKRLSGLAF